MTGVPLADKLPAVEKKRPHLGRLGRAIIRRFSIFAFLSLVVLAAAIGYAAWRQYEDRRALLQHSAAWMAGVLDGWLHQLYSGLEPLADPSLLDASPQLLQAKLFSALQYNPLFRSISLADARVGRQGIEILTVTAQSTSSTRNFHGFGWFRGAYDNGRFISRVDFTGAAPIATVSLRVDQDGQPAFVVAAQVDLTWASDLLVQAGTQQEDYVYVVDYMGQPILHQDSTLVTSGQLRADIPGIQAAVAAMQSATGTVPNVPSIYIGLNAQGEQVIGEHTLLREVKWAVIAEQPVRAATRQLRTLAYAAGGVLLLSVVAAIVVGAYISRSVARPIMLLHQGAQRLGAGTLDERIVLPERNELSDLADEFNRMAANIQQDQARIAAWGQELEERVAQRTAELQQALDQIQKEAETRQTLLHTIRELSSPVIPVFEGVMVTPIVGALDSARAQRMREDILAEVERRRTRVLIIDITGLSVVDTAVANSLLQTAQAAQLLGAQPILVGITPAVAETIVALGVQLGELRTAATLQEGLRIGLAALQYRIVRG